MRWVGRGHGFPCPSNDEVERGESEEVKSILLFSLFTIFLPEPFDPSRCIQEFLLPSEERMTAGTNLHTDLFLGALRLKGGTTGAFDQCIKNFRMDILLHLIITSKLPFYRFFSLFQPFFKLNDPLPAMSNRPRANPY